MTHNTKTPKAEIRGERWHVPPQISRGTLQHTHILDIKGLDIKGYFTAHTYFISRGYVTNSSAAFFDC